jgi:hypothetical protein
MGDASLSRSFPVVGFSANPRKKKLAGVGVCYAESVSGVEEKLSTYRRGAEDAGFILQRQRSSMKGQSA